MSEDSSQWPLFNLHTGEPEEARLFHTIAELHVVDVENSWKPILEKHLSKLKAKHQYGTEHFDELNFYAGADELMIRDARWDWINKYSYFSSTIGYSGCAIVCDEKVQGVGYFDLSGEKRSRIVEDKPTGILYVEFIASAPWNRKQIENQKYAGVGEILVAHAIQLSMEEGMKGRFGLHSLSQAENFYRDKCGMTDFGYDDDKKMNYFEMSVDQADDFLSKFVE